MVYYRKQINGFKLDQFSLNQYESENIKLEINGLSHLNKKNKVVKGGYYITIDLKNVDKKALRYYDIKTTESTPNYLKDIDGKTISFRSIQKARLFMAQWIKDNNDKLKRLYEEVTVWDIII